MSKKISGRMVKESAVLELKQELKASPDVFVTKFSKLSVNSLNDLRRKLKATNVKYEVVKNSLGRKALEDSKQKEILPLVDGMCGLGFSNGDMVMASKVFLNFAGENAGFAIAGAYLEGKQFSPERLKYLASLPSREELLAKIVGGLKSPINGVVYVLKEVASGFVRTLNQIKDKKEKS